jgi:hypothetical protein
MGEARYAVSRLRDAKMRFSSSEPSSAWYRHIRAKCQYCCQCCCQPSCPIECQVATSFPKLAHHVGVLNSRHNMWSTGRKGGAPAQVLADQQTARTPVATRRQQRGCKLSAAPAQGQIFSGEKPNTDRRAKKLVRDLWPPGQGTYH